MNKDRVSAYVVREQESDLWIGISSECKAEGFEDAVLEKMKEIRLLLNQYIHSFPLFNTSFKPLNIENCDPPIIKKMKVAGLAAGTGPMAAVAGLIAEEIGLFISDHFSPDEIIIENGGDIYISLKNDMVISIDSGGNNKFGSLGIIVNPEYSPLGICTSSGMFGHSISLGKADSVTVACRSTPLADAWATSIGNRVQQAEDIEKAIELFRDEFLSLICIKDDKIGIKGCLELTHIP
jgi:ApbE superfamily uncharacterized protein (UPF0280 family)